MPFSTRLFRFAFSNRLRQIEHFRRNPLAVQHNQIADLLKKSADCNYLKTRDVHSVADFQSKIPIVGYEALSPEINKMLKGGQNVLWTKPTKWFAKSSGTTNDKSKYIPVTRDSLYRCHFKGGTDLIAIVCDNFPDTKALTGKTLTLGGSHQMVRENSGVICGDLSAIMIQNTPKWFRGKRVPSSEVALIPDFEQKVAKICKETINLNVTNFAGVPSWNLVLMNKILEYTGKNNIHEIWPNMSMFAHGGISFVPYREQYARLFPNPDMKYVETYNASEGFFAIQDDPNDSAMLLMLDYGIYYEFIPVDELEYSMSTIPLEGVKIGVNYAIIITTNGGLWRYMIGDTVEFTSTNPYKIKVTGRTKQYINTFGEEVMEDNTTISLKAACDATGAVVTEYTVAPVYMEIKTKGRHQWILEFEREPDSRDKFMETLDKKLQSINSDYEAKRSNNTTLEAPLLTAVPQGTFYDWMSSRGKNGGQNKIPRLSNDRQIAESILNHLGEYTTRNNGRHDG